MSRFRFDRATSLFTMCRSSMVPLPLSRPPSNLSTSSSYLLLAARAVDSNIHSFFFIKKLVLFCNERLTSFSQSCSVLPTVFFSPLLHNKHYQTLEIVWLSFSVSVHHRSPPASVSLRFFIFGCSFECCSLAHK